MANLIGYWFPIIQIADVGWDDRVSFLHYSCINTDGCITRGQPRPPWSTLFLLLDPGGKITFHN